MIFFWVSFVTFYLKAASAEDKKAARNNESDLESTLTRLAVCEQQLKAFTSKATDVQIPPILNAANEFNRTLQYYIVCVCVCV